MKEPVITGMGITSSIGKNIFTFSRALRTGRCGIHKLNNYYDAYSIDLYGAEIPDFNFKSHIDEYQSINKAQNTLNGCIEKAKKIGLRSSLTTQLSIIPALEAWQQADLNGKPADKERVSVIAAGSNLNQEVIFNTFKKYHDKPMFINPSYALSFLDTNLIGVISDIFEINGEGLTTGGASASGNVALIKGMQLIQTGYTDVCMVLGPPAILSPLELIAFYNIGAMRGTSCRPEEACRPFDKGHEGFIYGMAGACIILESAESVSKRDVPTLAKLSGGAINIDGNRLSNPDVEGEAKAMSVALNRAGIEISKVQYLNAHGSSSPLGDKSEVEAIKKVFGRNLSKIRINSTKSLTGHCLWSAGIVEAITTIIQMNEGFVHPNRNLDNPIDTECRFCGSKSEEYVFEISLSNSFGFAGINTSLVLIKGDM